MELKYKCRAKRALKKCKRANDIRNIWIRRYKESTPHAHHIHSTSIDVTHQTHIESCISNNSKHELAITVFRVRQWLMGVFRFCHGNEKFGIEIKKHVDFFYIDEFVMYITVY